MIGCKIFTLIIILSVCSIGIYFTTKHVQNNYIDAKITKLLHRNCWESGGFRYMEQYVQIQDDTHNHTGIISCWRIIDCDTSPCNHRFSFGQKYMWVLYDDQLYELGDYTWYYLLIAILICFGSVPIVSFTFNILCKNNNQVPEELKPLV